MSVEHRAAAIRVHLVSADGTTVTGYAQGWDGATVDYDGGEPPARTLGLVALGPDDRPVVARVDAAPRTGDDPFAAPDGWLLRPAARGAADALDRLLRRND
jgi:hypothetical protein